MIESYFRSKLIPDEKHFQANIYFFVAAETLQSLVARLAGLDFSFCYWLLITTFFLTPLLWYGTPKDLG